MTSTNLTRKSIFVLKGNKYTQQETKKIGKCTVPGTNNKKHNAQVPVVHRKELNSDGVFSTVNCYIPNFNFCPETVPCSSVSIVVTFLLLLFGISLFIVDHFAYCSIHLELHIFKSRKYITGVRKRLCDKDLRSIRRSVEEKLIKLF